VLHNGADLRQFLFHGGIAEQFIQVLPGSWRQQVGWYVLHPKLIS
jgi:hypothetical protein